LDDKSIERMSVSVIIPVYGGEQTIAELVRRASGVLAGCTAHHEFILVNDASPDGSWHVLQKLASADERVHAIDLMRNYGQHNALLCGIRAAKYDVIVTMDDDLQHPPEEIPKLLVKFAEGYDVVYGTPQSEQHGLLRNLASQVTKLALQSAMGIDIASRVGAFRVFRADLRASFADYCGPLVSIDVLLTWATTRFEAVPVRHDPRSLGMSNYTFRKLVTHALNMMTGFSTLPLQLASMIGFAFTVFGICVLGYVLGCYLIQGASVPGFAFLASVVAIFSGAQLFALGIIGEYLARMHFRMMEKPAYVVRSTTRRG
jgi:undecaprenyl-phosphate 4-deoxy-4-formamido-L-arabinose transferase